jgi:ComF family protein
MLCKQSSDDVICSFCFSNLEQQINSQKGKIELDDVYDYYHLFAYSKEIKYLLTQLKFNKNLIVSETFNKLINTWWNTVSVYDLKDVDTIAVVPIHRLRYLYRGFNQSEIFGECFAKCMNIEPNFANYKRIKYTKAQAKSSKENRHKQISGVFETMKPIQTKHLVVFDDVLTTGATLSEFITTIKYKSHIDKISVVSLVRAG